MKIGVIGNYGATNVGDDAILTALIKLLSGHELTVFSATPDKTKTQFGVRSVSLFPLGFRSLFRAKLIPSYKALKEVDLVILGGGGLFQDSHLYACFLWAWQVFWVMRLKKPFFIYATGIGPLKTRLGKKLTKWAVRHARVITVRDRYSHDLLVNIGLPANKIRVMADPAFVYKKRAASKVRSKNLVLVSLRPWLKYNAKVISVFTAFLQRLQKEKNVEILFVSMQQVKQSDRQIIDPVMKKVGGSLYIPKHFADLLHEMEAAEFAIGMRYHFLIAALLTETPVLPVSYSPKVDELFKGTPLWPYVMQISEIYEEGLMAQMKRLSVDYNNVQVYERTRLHTLQGLAHQNEERFREILKMFK